MEHLLPDQRMKFLNFYTLAMFVEIFTPSLAPLLVCCMTYYAMTSLRSTAPPGRVSIRSSDKASQRTLTIDIGGSGHDNNWVDRLKGLSRILRRTNVMYNLMIFKVEILVNTEPGSEEVAIHNLRNTLEIISESANCPRGVSLDLSVRIIGSSSGAISDAIANEHVTLQDLGRLEKLRWNGPFPKCLLQTRPRLRQYGSLFIRFFGCEPPSTSFEVRFPHLKDFSLTGCVVDSTTLLDFISRSPTLTTMMVDRIGAGSPRNNDEEHYNQRTSQTIPFDHFIFQHTHLKYLTISSTINLSSFFKTIRLPNLEILSLRLSCSAIASRVEDDIVKLDIPWHSLKKFELKAPMGAASICVLNHFFKAEKAMHLVCDHVLVEDWWMDSRRRLSTLHPRMNRSLTAC
ncbi:hypothetical protein CPC08DRAFT_268618 [Agrocybe pediades]|nr:hypothetical protein CPC08DRAFT_268618 [Agrocybe pediades]